jgi:hypothetical protein
VFVVDPLRGWWWWFGRFAIEELAADATRTAKGFDKGKGKIQSKGSDKGKGKDFHGKGKGSVAAQQFEYGEGSGKGYGKGYGKDILE